VAYPYKVRKVRSAHTPPVKILILWYVKFSNLNLKTCGPIILKSLKSLKRTQLSSAHDQFIVYGQPRIDSAHFHERFLVNEHTTMHETFMRYCELTCRPYLSVRADGDGPAMDDV